MLNNNIIDGMDAGRPLTPSSKYKYNPIQSLSR